jgi:hypothetical protein
MTSEGREVEKQRSNELTIELEEVRHEAASFRFGKLVNVMTPSPMFFCKNVILKGMERGVAQECDSKWVRSKARASF